LNFQKEVFKLMLVFIAIFALLYGALEIQQSAINPYVEEFKELSLGRELKECLDNNYKFIPDNINDNPRLDKLETKLTIYGVLFLIVQIGILYLGAAFIVRKFNQPRLGEAEQTARQR